MIKEAIIYNGVRVLFRDMKHLYKYSAKCPICSGHIYKDDAIYSIINNYILFPNVSVHKGCVESKEKCVKQLVASYNQFRKMVKKYSFWQWNGKMSDYL